MERNKKIWLFDGGTSFSGNPKWLFMYMVQNHKEIQCYWISRSDETIKIVKKMGHKAFSYQSREGKKMMQKAGVYVVNQVKEIIPEELETCVILNLWHGVGCKSIERKVTTGFLNGRIAKKYITNNAIYKKNQLFLVTSPLMEKHFMDQCGIDEDKVIRAGYPCCAGIEGVRTFEHDVRKEKGLSQDTKIVVYSPTYRDNAEDEFFGKAIPNMERLIEKLEKNNMLLIFKMHPLMSKDSEYLVMKEHYENHPRLLFWNNENDIYEIFDQVTLGIVDYSSIFYDMMAAHVPYFIRYIFDYDNPENFRDLVFDYEEMTFGTIAKDFDTFLEVLDHYEESSAEDYERINKLFWEYATEDSLERIIKQTLEFEPRLNYELKTLYSFDIFDTLICRNTDWARGIFYYVKKKMELSHLEFPGFLVANYPSIRMSCESNVRERKKKDPTLKKTKEFEITLHEIYDRIQELYLLSDEQIKLLKTWEIEGEIENTTPIRERIDFLRELVEKGEKVVLISDMYLDEKVIREMLRKADPILEGLPLYLSSTCKVQKTTKELFYKVYHDVDYNQYGKWIHYGDSVIADKKRPESLGIETVNHVLEKRDDYEQLFTDTIDSYDAYLVAKLLKTYRLEHESKEDIFTYRYAAMYYVPYLNWVISDAIEKKLDTLYFISRDGYYLKLAADEIIRVKKLNIKTKYLYGSRAAWRIPSFIDEVDEEFFEKHGNFSKVKDFPSLLNALSISEEKFDELFPEVGYLKNVRYTDKDMTHIVKMFKNSKTYNNYILEKAEEMRTIILDYFNQEIDFDEKFAFTEYWGRGYTQTCMHRLLKAASKKHGQTIFYYARSIYGDEGEVIRRNFTSNVANLTLVEALFANVPYMTIKEYKRENGKVVPVIVQKENNRKLHESMEKNIVKFAKDLYSLNLLEEKEIDREIYNFALSYYRENPTDPYILENIAPLKDAIALNVKEREYAPELSMRSFLNIFKGEKIEKNTTNLEMTLGRSKKRYVWLYKFKVKLNTYEIVRKIGRTIREINKKLRNDSFNKN